MPGKVKIKLEDWDYECGDGCCYMFGTSISVNGVESVNQYDGDSVSQALEFVLKQLGYSVEIEGSYRENLSLEKLKQDIEKIEDKHS